MPQAIVGFVAGLGTTAAAAVGLTVAGAGALAVGSVTLALGVAGLKRARDLQNPGDVAHPFEGRMASIRSTEMPRNLVYGEAQVGGVITYMNSAATGNRSLYIEIVHTGHEIDSFIGWYLDDKWIPIADVDDLQSAGDGGVDANSGGHGLDDATDHLLYLRGHLGLASQAVDSALDTAFTDIDSNHRHRGCAKTVVWCDLIEGEEVTWNNGTPPQNVTAVVRGKKMYDPRLDSTFAGAVYGSGSGSHRLNDPTTWEWSDCPALIWADYRITAKPLGPGWDSSRIDYDSVAVAADHCDDTVAIPGSTTEKRFRCDLVVDSSMEPSLVTQKILASMFGNERHFNGYWHVYAGMFPTSDFSLDESDFISDLQFRKEPEGPDRYNQVKGQYFDRDRKWKPVAFLTVNDTTLRSGRDNARVLFKDLQLDGVSREYQAQRIAFRHLLQATNTGILAVKVGFQGLNIRPGDTGTVSFDEFGWTNKVFRCVSMKVIDFEGVELMLKEDDEDSYDDPDAGDYGTRSAAGAITFPGIPSTQVITAAQIATNAVTETYQDFEAGPVGVSNIT